jgi:hypothetical protein
MLMFTLLALSALLRLIAPRRRVAAPVVAVSARLRGRKPR